MGADTLANNTEQKKKEEEEEEEEVTTTTSTSSVRTSQHLEKKRELSRSHPTKALPIGSLQFNINLATKEYFAASMASPSTTSTSLSLSSSMSSTTATAAPTIATAATAATATCLHLAVVINELTHIWNSYKLHGQLAFMLYLVEENEDSFLALMKAFEFSTSPLPTKAECSTIRLYITSLFAHLLLQLTTGKETYSQVDKWTQVINSIYNSYTHHAGNVTCSNPTKYALSCLFQPPTAQLSKDLVCAWTWQIQCMCQVWTRQEGYRVCMDKEERDRCKGSKELRR
jgi:hypothetical protein